MKVLNYLANIGPQEKSKFSFNENYTLKEAEPDAKFSQSAPYLLDVANWHNDLFHGMDLEKVKQAAAETLREIQG